MFRDFRRLVLILLFAFQDIAVSGFVIPPSTPSTSSRPAFALHARPLPPIPPPPPRGLLDDPLGAVERLISDMTSALDFSSFQQNDADSNSLIPNTIQQWMSSVTSLQDQINVLDNQVLAQLQEVATNIQTSALSLLQDNDNIPDATMTVVQPLLDKLQLAISSSSWLSGSSLSPVTTLLVSSFLTFVLVSQVLLPNINSYDASSIPPSSPCPNGKYNPEAARAYFDRRLPLVGARGLQILITSLQFGVSLLKDKIAGELEANEYQRGRELATLLTKLGPSFIKIGQSLSIRTDLLSPAYARGLATLQDQVPAFSTKVATQILEQEWGRPVRDFLDGPLSAQPVAAASLGQVYKAKLRNNNGQTVAIKVQRPDITDQIALDMHLLREVAPFVKALFNANTDLVGTVDTWGSGFVSELDYLQEAINAEQFMQQIATTPLAQVVFAPTVVHSSGNNNGGGDRLSTSRVLVTEWIDGERLDKSTSQDVTILCSIAMNTYLTMLLELGVLHADPHPGNLLRTPDGRLCILDWGMVTKLDSDLQLTMIEHVAHLTSGDYAAIPNDLLKLGFIPPAKAADVVQDSGVVELLADIYGAWSKGGGAAAINVNEVVSQLQDLTAEKGNVFQIPPYFAYIAKSFSVLEGIGLSNDAKYSVIKECLPYISKRLLTDKEALGPALNTFIFGPAKSEPDRIVDYDRVKQLIEGFGEYTTSSSGALLGKESTPRTQLLEGAADQILDLVFTEEETPLQDILLDQMSKILTAESRSVFQRLRESSGTLPSGRTVMGSMMDPFGLFRTSPLVRMNELDERTVATTRKLVSLVQKQVQATEGNAMFDLSTLSREEIIGFASILVRKVWQRRMGVMQTGNRFARKLLQLTAKKLELGERDSRVLSSTPPQQLEEERVTNGSEQLPELQRNTTRVARTFPSRSGSPESPRLQQARRSLNKYHQQEMPFTGAAPKAVRVRSDP